MSQLKQLQQCITLENLFKPVYFSLALVKSFSGSGKKSSDIQRHSITTRKRVWVQAFHVMAIIFNV